MILMFTVSLVSILFLNFGINLTFTVADNGNSDSKVPVNDSIIQLFHRCQCTYYFNCDDINQVLLDIHANGSKVPLECTDSNYICCGSSTTRPNITVETSTERLILSTEETSTERVILTTEEFSTVSFRHIVTQKLSCGLPRTVLTARTLTPEVDSANTVSGEAPWIVAIFQQPNDNRKPYRLKCAGSLIHPKVVLTATHCVRSSKEKSLKIVATGQGIFQNVGAHPENERLVSKIIKHPEYYSGGLYNDIALVILQEPYDYSLYPLNSVCLPTSDQGSDGKKCLALGWGENTNLSSIPLKKVDVPTVNSQKCESLLRATRLGPEFKLHSSFLCAGGEEGKDTCKGDGGGPLVWLGEDYKFVQVGIVSWGVNCGVVNEPGLYANVAKFREWIGKELTKYEINLEE